jgi:hypothetical protein
MTPRLCLAAAAAALLLTLSPVRAADPPKTKPANLQYLWAKAYHIPPETTTGSLNGCSSISSQIAL